MVAVVCLFAPRLSLSAKTAQVKFTCLSVKVQPSYDNEFGGLYALRLGTSFPVNYNGDLPISLTFQADTNWLTGIYEIFSPSADMSEDFDVQVPALGDANHDGLNDFWNVDQGFDPIQTTGV